MEDQGLSFRYDVRGEEAVLYSLEQIEHQIDQVTKAYDRMFNASAKASRLKGGGASNFANGAGSRFPGQNGGYVPSSVRRAYQKSLEDIPPARVPSSRSSASVPDADPIRKRNELDEDYAIRKAERDQQRAAQALRDQQIAAERADALARRLAERAADREERDAREAQRRAEAAAREELRLAERVARDKERLAEREAEIERRNARERERIADRQTRDAQREADRREREIRDLEREGDRRVADLQRDLDRQAEARARADREQMREGERQAREIARDAERAAREQIQIEERRAREERGIREREAREARRIREREEREARQSAEARARDARRAAERNRAAAGRQVGTGFSQLGSFLTGTTRLAARAVQTVTSITQAVGGGILSLAGRSISLATTALSTGIGALRTLGSGAAGIASGVISTLNRAYSFARTVALYSAGIGAALAATIGRSSIEADANLRQLTATLEVASGSSAGAARELKFLREEADRLGIAIGEIQKPYAQFLTAFTTSGGSIDEGRQLFLGVSQAIRATGGSTEELQRALIAIQQSFGKGCHGVGSMIRLYSDGWDHKAVEDIVIGDVLMGPDGTGRNVISLARGRQEMFRVTPSSGEPFIVNLHHKMRLTTPFGADFTLDLSGYLNMDPAIQEVLSLINRDGYDGHQAVSFKVESIGEGEYFGFTLDGDHLYLDEQGFEHHNTLQAEELRGQLGEALPGAVALVAQNLGVTTMQLGKMTEAGLDARVAFKGFGEFLQNRFGAAAAKGAQGLTAARGRIANQLLTLRQQIGAGLNGPLGRILDDLNSFVAKLNGIGFGRRIGDVVGRGLERFYFFVKKTASDLSTVYLLITRGFDGLAQSLGRQVADNPFAQMQLGALAATKAINGLGPVGQKVLALQGRISQFYALTTNGIRLIGSLARVSALAARDLFVGLTGGSVASASVGTLNTVLNLVNDLTVAMNRFGADGGFVRAGLRIRDVLTGIRDSIYSLNGATGLRDFVFRSVAAFQRVIVQARFLKDSVVFAAAAIGNAFRLLIPALEPISSRLGKYVPEMKRIEDGGNLLARPFLFLGDLLNQLAANGAISRFADQVADGLEKTIVYGKRTIEFFRGLSDIIQGVFAGKSREDLQLSVATKFPGLPALQKVAGYVDDARTAIQTLGRVVERTIAAVDGFWKKWGGTIIAIRNAIITVADLFAGFFGVEDGKQVLILLTLATIAARLTGIGNIVLGLSRLLIPAITGVIGSLAGLFSGAATGIVATIAGVITGPVGLLALVAAAVVGAVALIYTNFDGIKSFFSDIPQSFADGMRKAVAETTGLVEGLAAKINDAIVGGDPTARQRELDRRASEAAFNAQPKRSSFDVAVASANRSAEYERMTKGERPGSPFYSDKPLPVILTNPGQNFITEPDFVRRQRTRDQMSDAGGGFLGAGQTTDPKTFVTIVDDSGRNKYGDGTTFSTNKTSEELRAGMRAARTGQPRSAPVGMRAGA